MPTVVRKLRCRSPLAILAACALTVALEGSGRASADEDFSAELPRIPPVEPAAALATFRTLPGFRIEQIAAEPLVHSPVAIAFDEASRMYVVEMIDYSEQDREYLGAVRLLEDTDGDGRMDKSTLFADKLSWPTAICCYDGGVFVGAAPDILYLKDTDGDGKADVQRTVFTGFNKNNVQGLLNSFHWGLDNRIHGATSTAGGRVRRSDRPDDVPLNLSGRDFAFDPKTLELVAESGGAQHGMCFDNWGRRFVSSNSDHIQLVMFEDRYMARNRRLAAPAARLSIAADGPQAEVFRISPVEPWRIVRTRERVAGRVPGPVEGGGRAAGYFTGATGVTIFRGDAWPEEYRGQAFIGDVGSNIVHRKTLEPEGVGLIARRADTGREFVASTDIWFRPAQFANAPDGNLHIIDVYREVIEHPASLPPAIKRHLDLTSGRDRGRIYRVVRDDFRQKPVPRLDRASTAELVAALDHPNGWHRDTATRLLYEKQHRAAVEPLRKLAGAAKTPQGRLHAIAALVGQHSLSADDVLARLSDAHPRVRERAIELAEPLAAGSSLLRDRLMQMATDPDMRVRYQLAFSLGEFADSRRNTALAQILKQDGGDRWMRLAVLSSLSDGASGVMSLLLADEPLSSTPGGREILAALAGQIGGQAQTGDVTELIAAIEKLPDRRKELAARLVQELLTGLPRTATQLRQRITNTPGRAQTLLRDSLAEARRVAGDDSLAAERRAEAVKTLRLAGFSDVRELLVKLLDTRQPHGVQLAALATLGSFDNPDIGRIVVDAWPTFGPTTRAAATETVFSRPEWIKALLAAVEDERIRPADVDPARLRSLERHRNAEVRAAAVRIAPKLSPAARQQIIDAYKPALSLAGDAERGKLHFQKICAVCHKLDGVGHEIGPNLASLQNRGAEAILVNVLDPNREVNPQYVNYTVRTTAGKSVSGLIAAETATSVTLKRQEGASDTILRADIEEMASSGLSIMPEGVEQQLDKQALADLIAYVLSAK